MKRLTETIFRLLLTAECAITVASNIVTSNRLLITNLCANDTDEMPQALCETVTRCEKMFLGTVRASIKIFVY